MKPPVQPYRVVFICENGVRANYSAQDVMSELRKNGLDKRVKISPAILSSGFDMHDKLPGTDLIISHAPLTKLRNYRKLFFELKGQQDAPPLPAAFYLEFDGSATAKALAEIKKRLKQQR